MICAHAFIHALAHKGSKALCFVHMHIHMNAHARAFLCYHVRTCIHAHAFTAYGFASPRYTLLTQYNVNSTHAAISRNEKIHQSSCFKLDSDSLMS